MLVGRAGPGPLSSFGEIYRLGKRARISFWEEARPHTQLMQYSTQLSLLRPVFAVWQNDTGTFWAERYTNNDAELLTIFFLLFRGGGNLRKNRQMLHRLEILPSLSTQMGVFQCLSSWQNSRKIGLLGSSDYKLPLFSPLILLAAVLL